MKISPNDQMRVLARASNLAVSRGDDPPLSYCRKARMATDDDQAVRTQSAIYPQNGFTDEYRGKGSSAIE